MTSAIMLVVPVAAVVVSVSIVRFPFCGGRRTCGVTSFRQPTLAVSFRNCPRLLATLMFRTVHRYPVSSTFPLYIVESRIMRRLPANLPPRHCTRPRGSAPLANALGVIWNLTVARSRVRDTCNHQTFSSHALSNQKGPVIRLPCVNLAPMLPPQ
jgi:hypothetical protein